MNKKTKQMSLVVLSTMALAGVGVASLPTPVAQASASVTKMTPQWAERTHSLYQFNKKGYAVEVGQIKKDKKYYYNSSMKTVKSKSGVEFYKITYNGKSYLLEYMDFWQDYPRG